MNDFAPWPSYSSDEIEAVTRVLQTNKVNYWTGQECREFEKEFANWVGTEYAIALANGTLALDAIVKILQIHSGDEVIVTSRTFIASISCIVAAGATPIFADVDADSQNITAESIQKVITENTKAIICVHLAGWPCDMDPILALAKEHKLFVIEDCAQAHGAIYKGRSVGALGDVAAWSFCQDKIMTTGGEGGMITTNNYALWEKLWAYKDHGKSFDAVYKKDHAPGFRWLHESFGSNYRMLEIQAVIGRWQLKKMSEWQKVRLQNAMTIWKTAENLPALRVPKLTNDIQHAAYKCYVFLKIELLKPDWDREKILTEILNQGVPCFTGSCSEVYLEKAFDNTTWRPQSRLPTAQQLGETSLMFLVHPTLTIDNLEKTCKVLTDVITQATL